MCPTPENDFVAFATGAGANVLSQAAYLGSSQLSAGQQPGIAQSALNNKALRQATYIASCLAQYLANITGNNVLDDGNQSEVLATMAATWGTGHKSQLLTSGTSWTTPSYISTNTVFKITLLGGGGGGGGVKLSSGSFGAGGGGAGGVGVAYVSGLSPNTSYTYGIGGGGSAGSNTGGSGGAGGTTSITIGATTYTATGGNGGNGNTGANVVGGGNGGQSSNCTINGFAPGGLPGLGSTIGAGGAGGSPPVPGAGFSSWEGGSTAGSNANGFGTGGGGAAAATTTGFIGGTGTAGYILIEW
jgi:hypothetical protein